MKLQITQDDVVNGIRENSARCPIALALKRHFGDRYYILHVEQYTIWARREPISTVTLIGWPLTDAQTFIKLFDEDGPVEPCEVEIRLLNESAD